MNLMLEELQRAGRSGDEAAIMELGRKVLDMDFCFGEDKYCEHRYAMAELLDHLERDLPPDCPRCGMWLTEQ